MLKDHGDDHIFFLIKLFVLNEMVIHWSMFNVVEFAPSCNIWKLTLQNE